MSSSSSLNTVAVLFSGGVDSAVLTAELESQFPRIQPFYIRCGMLWEEAELVYAHQFLSLLNRKCFQPLKVFDLPLIDLIPNHWSFTGNAIPDHTTPDEAVYLPGRNLLLLAKTGLWCRMNDIETIALGILDSNPFPDGTDTFFQSFQHTLNQALPGSLSIITPFAGMTKTEVLQRGAHLPLGSTFSCINPSHSQHCGECNKCEERRQAFHKAKLHDPTNYINNPL